jgi:hypothetical protein
MRWVLERAHLECGCILPGRNVEPGAFLFCNAHQVQQKVIRVTRSNWGGGYE